MKRFLLFPSCSHRHRSMLRDLHAFGFVRVFRQHSIFRIWEPLREGPRGAEDSLG